MEAVKTILNPEKTTFDLYNVAYFYDENTKREQYEQFYVDILTEVPDVVGEVKVATVMVQCNDKTDLQYNDQYIVDVVTYDFETQEINGQLDQSRYNRNMEIVDTLGLPVIDDIMINGNNLDDYIVRMLDFIFKSDTNPNMRNPERYEVFIGHNGKAPVKVRHRGCFAWEGCHKIYICQTIEDVYTMLGYGYTIYPIETLKAVYKNSCPLKFINSANLKENFLPQSITYPKILGHKVKV